jgi:type III pantothenate kinase
MTKHWLLLDIGNTHTVAGLFSDGGEVVGELRFRTDPLATADEYRVHLTQLFSEHLEKSIWEVADRAILSTVVPVLEKTVRGACALG